MEEKRILSTIDEENLEEVNGGVVVAPDDMNGVWVCHACGNHTFTVVNVRGDFTLDVKCKACGEMGSIAQ